jgi:hypothetical protein
MADEAWNPWKMTTIGLLLVITTALVTTLVVANWPPSETARPTGTLPGKPAASRGRTGPRAPSEAPPAGRIPAQADIDACTRYASAQAGSPDAGVEIARDALIGGAAGAGLGAASGAIAGGGKGAGKGAAIGGLVGATAGTLYGLNERQKHDERYRAAYAGCMRGLGFGG